MATKKLVPAAKRTDLATLDAQLAEEAANDIARAISKPSGRKINVKNKQFVLPDGTVVGDAIDVIVLDFVNANRYYVDAFNQNNLVPPVCYAFGKDLDAMTPHETAPEKQSSGCSTCAWNKFESDPQGGKGKACKNTREVALLLAADAGDPDAPIFTMSISPTSLKSFDGIYSQVKRDFNGPLIKAVITVSTNPKVDYAQLVFSDPSPNGNYADNIARRSEANQLLAVAPDLSNYVPTTTPTRGRAQPAARGKRNVR